MSRVFGRVLSPYSLDQVLATGNSARDRHLEDVSNILFSDGGNYQNDTAIISQDITTLFFEINDLDASVNLLENPKMGQFYKTAGQSFPTGSLHITWDAHKDWTDFSAIFQRDASNFEVNISGVYYLDFNVSVNPTGATWTNESKIATIDLRRGASELAITALYGFQVSGTFYALSTNCIYELFPGDVINCRTVSSHSGTMNIASIGSGYDLNTYFTWRLIKTLP